ncbi:hypothetical protein GN958_ATG13029, partial [Phytophthora infestans]
ISHLKTPRGRKQKPDGGGRKQRQHKHTMSSDSPSLANTLNTFFPGREGTMLDTKRKSIYLCVKKKGKLVAIGIESWDPAWARTSLSADAEHDLVRWVSSYREEGAPVSSTMLRL